MSNAYSLLTAAVDLLKVDKTQVEDDEKDKNTARLWINDTLVTVSCTEGPDLVARARFDYFGESRLSIESEPFLGDYAEKLADMIKTVVYKKSISAPWVGVAVKELLDKKVKACEVTLEDKYDAILTIPHTSKTDKELRLGVIELSGNEVGSHFYRVDYLEGPTIGSVIEVADLDKAIKSIADIAEGAYNKWIKESEIDPEPKSDYERDMDNLFQFLKSRYWTMKDSSLKFRRVNGIELIIINISNGDRYFINYDSDKVCIRTLHNRRYFPSSKFFECDNPKRFESVASVIFSDCKRKKELDRDY